MRQLQKTVCQPQCPHLVPLNGTAYCYDTIAAHLPPPSAQDRTCFSLGWIRRTLFPCSPLFRNPPKTRHVAAHSGQPQPRTPSHPMWRAWPACWNVAMTSSTKASAGWKLLERSNTRKRRTGPQRLLPPPMRIRAQAKLRWHSRRMGGAAGGVSA